MDKITQRHLSKAAYIYIRQSTQFQVEHNQESSRRQYALADKARHLGWREVEVVDEDMGCSGSGSVKRSGFERMVAAVGMGQVGAVFSIEASRLARNNRDWHQLVDICGMVGTLIIDEEGIYDAMLLNDRLLLGLKGTMSEFELALIRQRMHTGLQQKAQRGELFRTVAVGYIRAAGDRCEKDPDERVRAAMELVLGKFEQTGSVRQTVLWFRQEGIELPLVVYGAQGRRVEWRTPTYSTIRNIITNPIYAGAYAFGRARTETYVEDGHMRKKQKKLNAARAREQWPVLIKEHHEGYISWKQYEDNLNKLNENSAMFAISERQGAVREGACLLAGLLRCSRCGRKLNVGYSGASAIIRRYKCLTSGHGLPRCISFSGGTVDQAVERAAFEIVKPAAVEASIQAAEQLALLANEKRDAIELSLRQARYEAQRAFAQYNSVDPANRLVATELERRWNTALEKEKELEQTFTSCDNESRQQGSEDHRCLQSLAADLSALWYSELCDMRIKKMIIRTLIEDIIADIDTEPNFVVLTIHWKGGKHSVIRVKRTPVGHNRYRTEKEAIDIIKEVAAVMPDRQIAATLNRLSHTTAHGKSWTQDLVRSMRKQLSVPAYDAKNRQGLVTMTEAAQILGTYPMLVKRLITMGVIESRQVVPYAPHLIGAAQLQTQRVRNAVNEAQRYGSGSLTTDKNQMSLNLS